MGVLTRGQIDGKARFDSEPPTACEDDSLFGRQSRAGAR